MLVFFECLFFHFKVNKFLKLYFNQFSIKNINDKYPDYTFTYEDYGYLFKFDISGICTYEYFIENISFLSDLFKAYDYSFYKELNYIYLKLYTNELKDCKYSFKELSPYQVLVGYDYDSPIIFDMRKTPHVLVSGLSNTGKSKMLYCSLKNLRNCDILIFNAFKKDYPGFTVINNNILNRLNSIFNNKRYRSKPLYIVIEELTSFCSNKKVQDIIKQLLAYGRHYNIYIIGVIQNATKENCSFKDLFNCRICFKQIDSICYKTCLGINYNEKLNEREFISISDKFKKGKTYLI